MEQIKWLQRKFDFNFEQNIFPSVIERLEGTPLRLKFKAKSIPTEIQSLRSGNSWSIKENIGHLTDLEELWQGRLEDILTNKEQLRAWDVENKKTSIADHNQYPIDSLNADFEKARKHTIELLKGVNETQIYQTALHPRLLQPMRLMDLFLFVAEHDDHHLARITALSNTLK